MSPYRSNLVALPKPRERGFRLLAPSPVCPRCRSNRWTRPSSLAPRLTPAAVDHPPEERSALYVSVEAETVQLAVTARRCTGRRRWLWGLVGPRLCPLGRPHVHASCRACGVECLEATPEDPEPGPAW